ncbi:MAG: hypothetical protein FJ241_09705 [Nitrospira sp.]|nr:hypothetical protein [Nitrospira sp.]
MNKAVYIQTAEKRDLSAILNLIKDYERYDVEFAKRYHDIYFSKNKITEQDEVFVAKMEGKTIGVIGFKSSVTGSGLVSCILSHC